MAIQLRPHVISKQDITPTPNTRMYPKGIAASAFQRLWDGPGNYRGEGILVAILDGGIDATNPNLAGRIVKSYNYTDGSGNKDHGTHVCGTICANGWLIGAAPEVHVIDIKIISDTGGSVDNLVQAIRTAASQGCQVINMSIGATTGITDHDIQQMTAAVDYAWNRGCVCVAAAGNSGDGEGSIDPYNYPASIDRVIGVGATTVGTDLQPGKIGSFSNENDQVDISACGVYVISCIPGDSYAVYSGTSMATPHVTAACALLAQQLKKQKPYLSGSAFSSTLVSILYQEVLDIGPPGKDISYGMGFFRYQPDGGPYRPGGKKSWVNGEYVGNLVPPT